MKESKRLIIALSILIGVAIIFIAYLSWPLLTGKAVILATMPVDPFDILRGQYITINYEISNIPTIVGAEEGNNIYVIVKEAEDKMWEFKSASLTAPDNEVFIKGRINSIYRDNMQIEYGIEQYFFERNAQIPTANLSVEVKISNSGQARILRLLDNGKPLEIQYE